jgi:Concanavalin A-like lectin/glucanases superfamily/Lysyl oxidase
VLIRSVEGRRFGLEISFAGRVRAGFVGVFLALFGLAWAASTAQAETLLYPNLKPLSPRDLRFDHTDVDAGSATVMHNVLRFSNTVWNTGPGPLEVRGSIDPVTKTGPATQRVYDDSGGFSDLSAGSFYYHPAHQHYHYDNWGRYELWTKAGYEAWLASGRTVGNPAVGAKTTSCMMDEEFIRNVPHQPYPPVYESEGCFPDSNGKMRQGISPGWGDTYDYFRFEQWIDLGPSGSLPDGEYVLRSVVDPTNKIYESPSKADPLEEGEEDNEAITRFSVKNGQLLDSNPPSGSIRVNNIDATTPTPNVGVKVLGRDDISGVTEVRLSNDGNSWTAPIAYTGQESATQYIEWNLTDPTYGGNGFDGTKAVYAQFEDATGKWSAPESDTIVLDRGGGSSAYSNAVEGDYPVGYWRLAEKSGATAHDAAGSNPGTYKNGTMLGQPSLLAGDLANSSARFDGSNDYVGIPSSPSLVPSGKVSVEAWIKPDALPSKDNFASIASKPESYSLQFSGPNLEFTIMQSGVRKRLQAPSGAVAVGRAYHVVGTYDGAIQRLYVNGVEVANAPLSGPITTNSKPLDIGSWSEGSEAFDGTIDEVAVYAGALSAARAAAHWQAGSGEAPPETTVKDPSGLIATAASETRIDLKWADNSDNEGEFLIQRDTSPTFAAPVILPVWANSTSFSDTELAPGTTYYYRVRARNATDSSNYSNTANATTLVPAPAPGSEGQSPHAVAPPLSGSAALQPPDYVAAVVDDDPIAYWRLDERSGWKALDAEGANPGTYWGNPWLGQAGLLPADASDASVRFDGVEDHVEVPSSPSLSPDRVSVEAWIEAAALPRRGRVAVIAGKSGSYSLGLSGPQLEFTVWLAGRVFHLRAPVGAIEARRVEHVVGVYDGSALRLFVDGARVAGARRPGEIAVGSRPFEVGSGGSSGRAFRGRIDEVAVYGKALAGARVAAHYRAGTLPRSRTARRSRAALASRYAPDSVIPAYCHLWSAGAYAAEAIAITIPPWLRPQT